MLTYAIVMLLLGLGLCRFAFVSPRNREGLEDVLFVGGVFGVLAIALCGIFFSEAGPWTPRLILKFAAVTLSNWLPYIGYKLGSYIGYQYEGKWWIIVWK